MEAFIQLGILFVQEVSAGVRRERGRDLFVCLQGRVKLYGYLAVTSASHKLSRYGGIVSGNFRQYVIVEKDPEDVFGLFPPEYVGGSARAVGVYLSKNGVILRRAVHGNLIRGEPFRYRDYFHVSSRHKSSKPFLRMLFTPILAS